jgi:hypothetical protein
MTPIDNAIAAIECAAPGKDVLYRKIAVQFNIDQTTLVRCHQGHTNSNAEEAQQRAHLNPEQERELVIYVQGLSERGLPPNRMLVKKIWPLRLPKPRFQSAGFHVFCAEIPPIFPANEPLELIAIVTRLTQRRSTGTTLNIFTAKCGSMKLRRRLCTIWMKKAS